MKIAVLGGTGFVGRRLIREHLAGASAGDACEVHILTRDPGSQGGNWPDGVRLHAWRADGKDVLPPGLDAVINLAGENVAGGRWTRARKQAIRDSRTRTTSSIVAALESASPRPRVLVNASAIGYYGLERRDDVDETSPAGDDFLARVCVDWERAAEGAAALGVRTALVRVGIVLGRDGGALSKMLLPFKLGLGGPIGDGRQWMSWIHIDDLSRLILHAIAAESLAGPLNGTAPEPVTNADFARALGRALGRPAFLPMPGFALRLLVGEFAEILLEGRRCLPKKVLESGFRFRFTDIDAALRDIVA